MATFPPELVREVLTHIPSKDHTTLYAATRTCRAWCREAVLFLWRRPPFGKPGGGSLASTCLACLGAAERRRAGMDAEATRPTFPYTSYVRVIVLSELAERLTNHIASRHVRGPVFKVMVEHFVRTCAQIEELMDGSKAEDWSRYCRLNYYEMTGAEESLKRLRVLCLGGPVDAAIFQRAAIVSRNLASLHLTFRRNCPLGLAPLIRAQRGLCALSVVNTYTPGGRVPDDVLEAMQTQSSSLVKVTFKGMTFPENKDLLGLGMLANLTHLKLSKCSVVDRHLSTTTGGTAGFSRLHDLDASSLTCLESVTERILAGAGCSLRTLAVHTITDQLMGVLRMHNPNIANLKTGGLNLDAVTNLRGLSSILTFECAAPATARGLKEWLVATARNLPPNLQELTMTNSSSVTSQKLSQFLRALTAPVKILRFKHADRFTEDHLDAVERHLRTIELLEIQGAPLSAVDPNRRSFQVVSG